MFCFVGNIGKAIIVKGGQSIADDFVNKQFVKASINYRITKAGNLQSKYVIHLAVTRNINLLPNLVGEVFQAAEELEITSVALPAIGTGIVTVIHSSL